MEGFCVWICSVANKRNVSVFSVRISATAVVIIISIIVVIGGGGKGIVAGFLGKRGRWWECGWRILGFFCGRLRFGFFLGFRRLFRGGFVSFLRCGLLWWCRLGGFGLSGFVVIIVVVVIVVIVLLVIYRGRRLLCFLSLGFFERSVD